MSQYCSRKRPGTRSVKLPRSESTSLEPSHLSPKSTPTDDPATTVPNSIENVPFDVLQHTRSSEMSRLLPSLQNTESNFKKLPSAVALSVRAHAKIYKPTWQLFLPLMAENR